MMPNNVPKVSIIIIINYESLQGPTNPRYKTTLCKHFNTPQGCSYGDKCQFAHGNGELRLNNAQGFPTSLGPGANANKMQNSLINYKIVKCKNWEKDGTCKYGVHCTFAHGDKDLRNKGENIFQMNNPMMMIPMMYDMNSVPIMMSPPPGMDMNQMQQMMAGGNLNQNQLMMMNMMPPAAGGMPNNESNNVEPKSEPQQ